MAGSPAETRTRPQESGNLRWWIAFWTALTATLLLAVIADASRPEPRDQDATAGWWAGLSPDWRPFLPVLLLAYPLALVQGPLLNWNPSWWRLLGRWGTESCPALGQPGCRREGRRALGLSLLVAIVALAMSWSVGQRFGDLPPAYHDEFSYLFQAKTFLAGRLSFPSHPQMPELFNQVHVLNEGRFASRYFPGVGLWLAPFVTAGNPWWGYWLAHAIASNVLFWIGRHLANNSVGLAAGLLLAVAPGVALFSNLLLAHHPTLVGLLIFVVTFLKLRQAIAQGTRLWVWAILAGSGLTCAMLCRPMTAAGVGLPFGLWFGWWMLAGADVSSAGRVTQAETGRCVWPLSKRLQTAVALGLPIFCGLLVLCGYNRAVTGDALRSPYQQYTDIYTPRHRYGFNNVVVGEQRLGPKVLENYDTWAENLTPVLALRNVGRRLTSSLRWTLGIVPLSIAGLLLLLTVDQWNGDWRLIAAAIICLHAVHVPYWFEGIMGWHYVFESAPFWLLIAAGTAWQLWRHAASRHGLRLWIGLMAATAVTVNLLTVEPVWPARLDVGIAEVSFARQRYATFQQQMQQLTQGRPALILINPDPADRHLDYVVNEPSLSAVTLYGRYDEQTTPVDSVIQSFPDRDIWLVDVASGVIEPLARRTSDR